MKRIFIIITALFVASIASAQSGKDLLKQAQKALDAYTNDFSQAGELANAAGLLDKAFEDPKLSADAGAWVTKGKILLDVADAQTKQRLLDPSFSIKDATSAVKAVEALSMALDKATKKGHTKDALSSLAKAEGILNNMGIDRYQSQDYTAAFDNFNAELKANELLKNAGKDSRLDGEGLYAEKSFFAGITGYYAEKYEASTMLLKKALEAGSEESASYQLLYEGLTKLDKEDEALKYLQAGRAKYPDDSGLLFSEINYYLTKGELEKMIGNLESALDKEPENTSVMITLGQVYDQLATNATKDGNEEKSNEYLTKAVDSYKKALAVDAEDFTANYSLGAMHYNKAAAYGPALNEAAEDFSAAGNKKYDEIQAKMNEQFELALPYFQKADEINPEDQNTLIALKEIFVRKDMLDKANEYKARLEALGAGQ